MGKAEQMKKRDEKLWTCEIKIARMETEELMKSMNGRGIMKNYQIKLACMEAELQYRALALGTTAGPVDRHYRIFKA
jgi:hypothetical protein